MAGEICDIDRARFAYLLSAELDELGLSIRQVARICGCSVRQVQFARNGKPVSAGAVYMLCLMTGIDIADLLPAHLAERRRRILKTIGNTKPLGKQSVTPAVSRETRSFQT